MQYKCVWRERFKDSKDFLDMYTSPTHNNQKSYPNYRVVQNPEKDFEIEVWELIDAVDEDDCIRQFLNKVHANNQAYVEVREVNGDQENPVFYLKGDFTKMVDKITGPGMFFGKL